MNESSPFLSLLLITVLAAMVPLMATLFHRFRVPIVVGEILAGIIIGRSGFNLIEPSATLQFLALFGFTYLMFVSGLEFDFATLSSETLSREVPRWRRVNSPFLLGLAVFASTFGLAFLGTTGLEMAGLVSEPFMISLILTTTSLGIVVPVLKERGLISSSYGQTILVTALIADFGTLVLITLQVAILSRGLTLDLLVILLLMVIFAVTLQIGRYAAGWRALKRIMDDLAHATAQIQVRGAVALMVGFIVLSEWLGIEVILGAFLAGVLISLLSPQERGHLLRIKIEAIGFGFFIPIFFIMVGVGFDLPSLLASPRAVVLVPLLLVLAYGVKFASSLLFRLAFPWRETFAAGGLLSARLSLIIAASAIALELGIIDGAINSAIIVVAVVTCTASPLIFNRVLPPHGSAERRQGIIIVGLGEIPVLLAERLRSQGKEITLVGSDKGQLKRLRGKKFRIVRGDPVKEKVLEKAGAATAELLMAASTYDETNVAACRIAQDSFGVPKLIAQASNPGVADQLSAMGVRVVQPQLALALALEGALHFPAIFDILVDTADGVEVRETRLRNPEISGELLRNIRLPGNTLVMGLRRKGEVIVPHGDTVFRQNDLVMLLGSPDALLKAIAYLNK